MQEMWDYADDKRSGKAGRALRVRRYGEPDRVRWQATARRGLRALPAWFGKRTFGSVGFCRMGGTFPRKPGQPL